MMSGVRQRRVTDNHDGQATALQLTAKHIAGAQEAEAPMFCTQHGVVSPMMAKAAEAVLISIRRDLLIKAVQSDFRGKAAT